MANLGERASNGGGRPDDGDAAIVKTRLGLFKQNTLPMLKYFDEKGKLKVVRAKMRVRKQPSASAAVFSICCLTGLKYIVCQVAFRRKFVRLHHAAAQYMPPLNHRSFCIHISLFYNW